MAGIGTRQRLGVTIAVLAMIGASCSWPMAGHGPDQRDWDQADTAITPGNAAAVESGWQAAIAGPVTGVVGNPDIAIARGQDIVVGLDPRTGATRWSASYAGSGPPALDGEELFVPSDGRRCRIAAGDAATDTPHRAADLGLVPGAATLSTCQTGAVLVDGDRVLVPWAQIVSWTDTCGPRWRLAFGVTVYAKDLEPLWLARTIRSGCDRPVPSDRTPLRMTRVGDNYVAASTHDTVVYPAAGCGDPSRACPETWVLGGSPYARPVAALNDRQVLYPSTTYLYQVDVVAHLFEWSDTPDIPQSAAAAADSRFAYSPVSEQAGAYLTAYPVAGCGRPNCSPSWYVRLPSGTAQQPSIAGTVVYLVTTDRHLVLVDANGCSAFCTPLTTLALGAVPTAPASIVAGRVLVPTASGVETFALPG